MGKISQYHIDECERQGCTDWNEYCNINGLNYSDLIDDDDEDDDDY